MKVSTENEVKWEVKIRTKRNMTCCIYSLFLSIVVYGPNFIVSICIYFLFSRNTVDQLLYVFIWPYIEGWLIIRTICSTIKITEVINFDLCLIHSWFLTCYYLGLVKKMKSFLSFIGLENYSSHEQWHGSRSWMCGYKPRCLPREGS